MSADVVCRRVVSPSGPLAPAKLLASKTRPITTPPSSHALRPQNLAMENMQNVTAALNALGVKTCLACGKAGAKSLCMGCRSVSFCGKACQKVAWPGHKKECRRIVREKAEALKKLRDPIEAAFAADEAMAAEEC